MKVSKYLREWQLSGKLPEGENIDPSIAFWVGYLVGRSKIRDPQEEDLDWRREMAIKCAEFIEERAK